jgi:hypothetical protein
MKKPRLSGLFFGCFFGLAAVYLITIFAYPGITVLLRLIDSLFG